MVKHRGKPLRARQSFIADGRIINKNEIVGSDDPITIGRENLFAPVGGVTPDDSEMATNNPGERRVVTRKKSTSKDN